MSRILLITNNFGKNSSNQRARKLFRRTEIFSDFGWETDVVVFNRESFIRKGKVEKVGKFYLYNLRKRLGEYLRYLFIRLTGPKHMSFAEVCIFVYRASKLIRNKKYDVVVTMCSPFTTHVAGMILKRIFNISWVVEFRDPWVKNENKFSRQAPLIHKILERKTALLADLIVWNYGVQLEDDYFSKAYGDTVNSKLLILPAPGFEGIDIGFRNASEDDFVSEKFTITYAGGFYSSLTPFSLFDGIK